MDLTVEELAQRSGLTDSRIRQLLIAGEIKGYKRTGAWFIPEDEAEKFLAKRRDQEGHNATETELTEG